MFFIAPIVRIQQCISGPTLFRIAIMYEIWVVIWVWVAGSVCLYSCVEYLQYNVIQKQLNYGHITKKKKVKLAIFFLALLTCILLWSLNSCGTWLKSRCQMTIHQARWSEGQRCERLHRVNVTALWLHQVPTSQTLGPGLPGANRAQDVRAGNLLI